MKAGSRYYKIQHLMFAIFCLARLQTYYIENEIAQRNVNTEHPLQSCCTYFIFS